VWTEAEIGSLLNGDIFIYGTEADDLLVGDARVEHIFGRGGNDTLRGNDGDDFLYGEQGNDILYGGNGNDVLSGGEGNDKLYGERGDDVLRGGQGNDTLYDVAGDETYYFALGDGADTLLDTQGDDTLVFEGIDYTDLVFAKSANGRSLEISVQGTGDRVTVTDWFLNESRQIEHIQAGEHELDGTDVAALVDALADYADSGVPLEDILATYWA
jgi:Ca2+-binding RTX toxin-like protein